ncbi:hypothetical protein DFH07DRAFT_782683 [Mycena maculata]|uniref:Uncharacterized protein n=1 Tax=Mycena maculata TaxID=230809 RepID=A0AAD7HRK6_9AGAR|nr:hypothetical protein DFH07DRAFT_782683 [Mycena maculata]
MTTNTAGGRRCMCAAPPPRTDEQEQQEGRDEGRGEGVGREGRQGRRGWGKVEVLEDGGGGEEEGGEFVGGGGLCGKLEVLADQGCGRGAALEGLGVTGAAVGRCVGRTKETAGAQWMSRSDGGIYRSCGITEVTACLGGAQLFGTLSGRCGLFRLLFQQRNARGAVWGQAARRWGERERERRTSLREMDAGTMVVKGKLEEKALALKCGTSDIDRRSGLRI